MASLKGPGEAQSYDGINSLHSCSSQQGNKANSHHPPKGSSLRIAIVHARWNESIIHPLVAGARKSLLEAGVKEDNIITQSVPGSYELPLAVQRTISTLSSGDLLGSSTTDLTSPPPPTSSSVPVPHRTSTAPFDAVIAIGVLIKGETMHFEYIAEATSQGLMRVQLDLGVPVVFGLLTVLSEEQAKKRAGVEGMGHNHGEDWGRAAVELGVKRRGWGEGRMV
ncbi:MAG: hypothetical protein M1836_007135 [Candelina mexicana]|nr:MAG: hypothetical protein M1836_007135 [Candelina mexicana]